jgi:hypothetical protein
VTGSGETHVIALALLKNAGSVPKKTRMTPIHIRRQIHHVSQRSRILAPLPYPQSQSSQWQKNVSIAEDSIVSRLNSAYVRASRYKNPNIISSAKSRTIMVRLISMAMTGYYRTLMRPRVHRPLSMLKYDPIGTSVHRFRLHPDPPTKRIPHTVDIRTGVK